MPRYWVTASLDYRTFVNAENMEEAQKEGLKEIERMCNTRSWKENAEECVLGVVEMNTNAGINVEEWSE